MNEDEQRGREIQAAIARILEEEWDPMGVRDEPEAAGEYDMYVGGIYRLLASGAQPDQLAEHLAALERDRMGFTDSHAAMVRPVADELAKLDVRLRHR